MFDHADILKSGLDYLRYKVRHESILNKSLDKPNFRRKFQKMNLLINCKEKQTNVAHRAATLYRFDINVYEKLREFGFTFEF